MCDNFTPQQDRIILYAIGQLVFSNQLLFLTPNQKPYAGTTALYEGSNGLVSKPVLHLKLDKQFSTRLPTKGCLENPNSD